MISYDFSEVEKTYYANTITFQRNQNEKYDSLHTIKQQNSEVFQTMHFYNKLFLKSLYHFKLSKIRKCIITSRVYSIELSSTIQSVEKYLKDDSKLTGPFSNHLVD